MTPAKIRIGVFLQGPEVPGWIYQLLQDISSLPFCELSLVLLRAGNSELDSPLAKFFLYRLYRFLDSKRARLYHVSGNILDIQNSASLRLVSPRVTDAGKFRLAGDDLSVVTQAGLDILLNLDTVPLSAEVLGIPRLGVWHFHYGDQKREQSVAAGFWEIFNREPLSEVSLRAKSGDSSPEWMLGKLSIRTHVSSPFVNRSRLLEAGIGLVRFALERLNRVGFSLQDLEVAPAIDSRLPALPSDLEMLGFVLSNITEIFRGRVFASKPLDQWTVGVTGENPLTLSGNSFEEIRWSAPMASRFIADPFLVEYKGVLYVFVEDFSYRSQRGHIAVCRLNPDNSLSEPEPVLQQPFHLSFPYIFKHQDKFLMVPEQSKSGQVVLYEATDFPKGWVKRRVLLEDFPGIDNNIFFYDNRWWLFTSYGDYRNQDNNLHIFYADSLDSEFKPHRNNPVKLDICSSRSAGSIFISQGKIYRPSQNCSRRYGGAVVISEITKLSPDEFAETPVKQINPPTRGGFTDGFHTINRLGELTVVSGVRLVRNLKEKVVVGVTREPFVQAVSQSSTTPKS